MGERQAGMGQGQAVIREGLFVMVEGFRGGIGIDERGTVLHDKG